jgi:hypothetical protein
MLTEQVLSVIVAIWSPHNAVDVLPIGQLGVLREAREVRGTLVIEFD